jgi:hypothetical protein
MPPIVSPTGIGPSLLSAGIGGGSLTGIGRRLLTAGIVCAWALASARELAKFLPLPLAALALAAGAAAVALALLGLRRLLRSGRDLSPLWLAALFLVLVAAFAVLYPVAQQHIRPGQGSDREDALRVELAAALHHQDPYAARTFLHNRPTPLPGAFWLALPFYLLGHVAWQNLFWTAMFLLFAARFFRRRATALCLLTVFLLCAPTCLEELVTGGDYLTNCFYVLIAAALLLAGMRRSLPAGLAAGAFLGATLCSRACFPLLLIPLLALALQQFPRRRVLAAFAAVLASAAAVTLPWFQPHPLSQLRGQLALSAAKLAGLPPAMHASVLLPALALAIGCAAFFVRMTFSRALLLFSAGTFMVFAPPAAARIFIYARLHAIRWQALSSLEFLTVPALCFALWAFHRLEDAEPDASALPSERSRPARSATDAPLALVE